MNLEDWLIGASWNNVLHTVDENASKASGT